MALGQHLVRELQYEGGVDTLGKWMAHYLAEVMSRAETSESNEERHLYQEKAVNTILKLWDKRSALPGNAYPLSKYKQLLNLLEQITPNNNVFVHVNAGVKSPLQFQMQQLFDRFTRLMILALTTETTFNTDVVKGDEAAFEALDDTEKQLQIAMNEWYSFLPHPPERNSNTDTEPQPEIDWSEFSVSLLDEISSLIKGLRDPLVAALDETPD